MNKLFHIILVFLFSLTIISCGSSGDGKSRSGDDTSSTTSSDSTSNTSNNVFPGTSLFGLERIYFGWGRNYENNS